MPFLTDYQHFAGRGWDTGAVHNYYAYRRVNAPHTGEPYSEALLFGVSGGIVLGYFTFAYAGYDPHVALLTRNTFDPLETMLARLGVVQEVRQTSKPAKGVANLLDALADGVPPLVWADLWSLPYNTFAQNDGMWGMAPILVYGYDEGADQVWLADRAATGLVITTGELATARGRVKKEKFRLLTLDQPDPDKLPAAVTAGIWDCINLFTEKPPKGAANNWGLKAFTYWADLLTKPGLRQRWAKEFPPGIPFYAGLTTTLSHYGVTGIRDDADRGLYATFLAEAALILAKPALRAVAAQLLASRNAWQALAAILLPDAVAPFGETRHLIKRKAHLFRTQGQAALPEIHQINTRLTVLRAQMATAFPLSPAQVTAHCQAIAEQLLTIRRLEAQAIADLRTIMAG